MEIQLKNEKNNSFKYSQFSNHKIEEQIKNRYKNYKFKIVQSLLDMIILRFNKIKYIKENFTYIIENQLKIKQLSI